MWQTSDGYRVDVPRFRKRRLVRRLRQRKRSRASLRVISRVLGSVFRRAKRAGNVAGARAGSQPVFVSRLGRLPLVIFTRQIEPGRLELLYIGRLRG
jgi:hypothetical protein